MFAEFHFLRPEWLLGLLPLAVLLWWVCKPSDGGGAWARVCDAHLLRHLTVAGGGRRSRIPAVVLGVACSIALVALANPVWDKREMPVYKSQESRVIVLDLSQSMLADDLKPSRLSRARYKVEDLLDRIEEGQTGLVVFAGDAFVASPLTRDTDTIRSLLSALDPNIMPVHGSRADLGLRKAGELLHQAGVGHGEILLVADGSEGNSSIAAAGELAKEGFRTSVMAVGTEEGGLLPTGRGGLAVDASGNPISVALNLAGLQAIASSGGGRFTTISAGGADIDALLRSDSSRLDFETAGSQQQSTVWLERGPWLTLLLLPLAAMAFRRGWLLLLPLTVIVGMAPQQEAMANTWDGLWTRPDQQAAQALGAGDLKRAREMAVDPDTRGVAAYRAGDYEAAAAEFGSGEDPDRYYNHGNALARLGKFEEAIAAYGRALESDSGMEDAAFNKTLLEALLKQQQQQNQQQDQEQGGQQQEQQQSDGEQDPQQGGQEQAQSSGQEQGDQQQAAQNGGAPEQQSSEQSGQQSDAGQDQQISQQGQTNEQATGSASEERTAESSSQPERADTSGQDEAQQDLAEAGTDPGEQQQPGEESVAERNDSAPKSHDDEKSAMDQYSKAARSDYSEPGDDEAPNSASDDDDPERLPESSDTDTRSGGMADIEEKDPDQRPSAYADALSSEEMQAAEQWLRRIPDDPGALLRRKFLYQYSQRANAGQASAGQAW